MASASSLSDVSPEMACVLDGETFSSVCQEQRESGRYNSDDIDAPGATIPISR